MCCLGACGTLTVSERKAPVPTSRYENFQMSPLQLKISPPKGLEWRDGTLTVSERKARENFQMSPLQLKISPPKGLEWRDGTLNRR